MDWLVFSIALGACMAAATTGSVFPPGAWYQKLDRPAWTPPNWLFPIAWTLLYIAMSVAVARVAGKPGAEVAMMLWALQIALNTLWTPIFFGLRRLGGAIVVIGAMWLAVAACTVMLWELDVVAGVLFVPYLIWVSYAGALNVSIWRRNPGVEPLRTTDA